MPTKIDVHAVCPNCGYEQDIPVNVATEISEQKPEADSDESDEERAEEILHG